MADTITRIQPSDLISDSMTKINRNFEIISNRDDVTESKLNQWTENIENKLADMRNENGIISSTILNNVQKLENKIDNLTNLDDITKEVENAINNATIDVEGLINDKADELIFSKLDDYVKTSTLNKRLEGYVKSTANFNIDSSGNVAVKATSLQIKKSEGSGDWVDISDEAKLADFVKTHQNNVSGGAGSTGGTDGSINADKILINKDHTLTVPSGGKINVQSGGTINVQSDGILRIASNLYISSSNGWINIGNEEKLEKFVKDHQNNVSGGAGDTGGTGSSINASSIFQQANEDSSISLNADKILINTDHPLTIPSGGRITSDNFSIYSNGNVDIKAEYLKIKDSANADWIDISDEAKLSEFVKTHQDTVVSGTTIEGDLRLSNDMLIRDSKNKINTGIYGSNKDENDGIRIFVKPQDLISPTTKQKLIRVGYTGSSSDPTLIFVRYPSLDKGSENKYAWVYDEGSKGRTISSYCEDGYENLNKNIIIYTTSPDAKVNSELLEITILNGVEPDFTLREGLKYNIEEVSKYGIVSESELRIYNNGKLYARNVQFGGISDDYNCKSLIVSPHSILMRGDMVVRPIGSDTKHASYSGEEIQFTNNDYNFNSEFNCECLRFGSRLASDLTDNRAIIDGMGGRIYVRNMYHMPNISLSSGETVYVSNQMTELRKKSQSDSVTVILPQNKKMRDAGENYYLFNVCHAKDIILQCDSNMNIISCVNGVEQITSNSYNQLTYSDYPSVIHVYWCGTQWTSYKIS